MSFTTSLDTFARPPKTQNVLEAKKTMEFWYCVRCAPDPHVSFVQLYEAEGGPRAQPNDTHEQYSEYTRTTLVLHGTRPPPVPPRVNAACVTHPNAPGMSPGEAHLIGAPWQRQAPAWCPWSHRTRPGCCSRRTPVVMPVSPRTQRRARALADAQSHRACCQAARRTRAHQLGDPSVQAHARQAPAHVPRAALLPVRRASSLELHGRVALCREPTPRLAGRCRTASALAALFNLGSGQKQ